MIDFDSLKATIRERTDLVDLVREHVTLRPGGKDLMGLCPFHQEKTPSFSVSPTKQIFKCFGCGAGGDVFTFVQLRERVGFPEAMRILADRAGIDMDRRVGRAPAGGVDRADLARVNAWALGVFQKALRDGPAGQIARDYVASRGISPEMVGRFALGWAPDDSRWLLAAARQAGLREELLRAAGLVQVGESGEPYGVFRGRLMFPIRDTMNRAIGFGGRTLKGDRAKYLNTAQNALFDKGRNLYGIDLARAAMTETHRAIVVEGYTDCIAAHQSGFANTVATLGTALTAEQVGLLRRWSDEVVLVFDSDAAGVEAADRALGVALTNNLSVRIARVPEGKDPADFLGLHGAAGFAEVLNSSVDALGFKWARTCERFAGGSGAGRKDAVQEFVSLVAGMSRFRALDTIQRGLIANQLSKLLAVPAGDVHALLTEAARSRAAPTRFAEAAAAGGGGQAQPAGRQATLEETRETDNSSDAEQSALASILRILINEPGHYAEVADVFKPARLHHRRLRHIATHVAALCEAVGEFRLTELTTRLEDPEDTRLVADLAYEGEQLGSFREVLADTRLRLEQLAAARRRREAAEAVHAGASAPADKRTEGAADEAESDRLLLINRTVQAARCFAPGVPVSTGLERRAD